MSISANKSNSRPPTPPARPVRNDEWRFKTITSPCEWIEDYRPGGYHPVHLGDIFKDGRYMVIRKLGEGSYSTVWLARDLRRNAYVALKVLVSQITDLSSEVRILRHITAIASMDEAKHITKLLDEFDHHGPNGLHKCLIFELMGPSVNSLAQELPQFKPRRQEMVIRYPPQMAKRILKQSLEALAFLHEHGISHGDFQPGNILFALCDIDLMPEDKLKQIEDAKVASISPPVERLDGKDDEWAPRYLYIAQPLAAFALTGDDLQVKLSDMGGAYFFSDPPEKVITPLGLRAPELILTGIVDRTLDVWSFGCLVFELMTGQPLFCVPASDFEDDEHLLIMFERLGNLPRYLFDRWANSSLYFTPKGQLFNCQLGGVADGEEPLMLEQVGMEVEFDRAKPEINAEEARMVKMLIRRILQFDPANRPTAREILLDPWFRDE